MSASGECGRPVQAADILVAVIAGGQTAERESSLASGHHVFRSLRNRYRCVLLELRDGDWSVLAHHIEDMPGARLTTGEPLEIIDATTGAGMTPTVAVLCTHGFPGETGELQGLLSLRGIPYCSSGVLASALAADKYRCGQYLRSAAGLTTPRLRRITSDQLADERWGSSDFTPPFILKPTSLGSSLGVLSVHDVRGVPAAFDRASALRYDYVVSEYIDGVEITAGAVRFKGRDLLLPAASVSRGDSTDELGIRSFADHKSVQLHIPPDVPAEALSEIRSAMHGIGEALDLVGCYRADFIWSQDTLFFLEVNTIPGLGEHSAFTRLAEHAGLSVGDLLAELIEECRLPGDASPNLGPD